MGFFNKLMSTGQPAHDTLFKAAKRTVNFLAPERANDSATVLECILFATSYIFITLHSRNIPNYNDFTVKYTKLLFAFIDENNLAHRMRPDVNRFIDQHMDLYSRDFHALMQNQDFLPVKTLTAIMNPLCAVDRQVDSRVFNPMLSFGIAKAYSELLKTINDKF